MKLVKIFVLVLEHFVHSVFTSQYSIHLKFGEFMTSNDRLFGCPIHHTDNIYCPILFIDTSTILDTANLIGFTYSINSNTQFLCVDSFYRPQWSWGNIFRSMCQEFCPQGGMHGKGVCMPGQHVWQGVCVAGGMCGRGRVWQAGWRACMVGGHAWQAGGRGQFSVSECGLNLSKSPLILLTSNSHGRKT